MVLKVCLIKFLYRLRFPTRSLNDLTTLAFLVGYRIHKYSIEIQNSLRNSLRPLPSTRQSFVSAHQRKPENASGIMWPSVPVSGRSDYSSARALPTASNSCRRHSIGNTRSITAAF